MITDEATRSFLSGHRIAVVGASDSAGNCGRTICAELAGHGYEPVPVHPTLDALDGRRCFATVGAIEPPVDGVIVMVPSEQSAAVVEDAAAGGVTRVWLFQGIGKGSVSEDALAACDRHGLETVPGACPLMFLTPVGGMHHLHRRVRQLRHQVEKPVTIGTGS